MVLLGLRWAGRCWPCCRSGSPTSPNGGRPCRPCSWRWPVSLHSSGPPPCTACSAGCGHRPCSGLVVWMFLRARRQLHGRSARWLLYPVFAVLAIASVGGGYETVRESLDARAYPMPGQLIDVGGHRLHLHCTGSGSPTVVLEPGGAASPRTSGGLRRPSPATARVCVYDRAGRGWSDAADSPRTAPRSPPTCTRCSTAHTFPARTCWPVTPSAASTSSPSPRNSRIRSPAWCCSTPLHPNPARPTANTESDSVVRRVSALLPAVAHVGAGRLFAHADYGSLPPRSRDEARANSSTARHLGSFVEESLEGVRLDAAGGVPDRPQR